MTSVCPCGRTGTFGSLAYESCCARYVDVGSPTHLQAPDPVSLMRSRYTAYVRGETAYLLATWDPSTRPQALDDDGAVTWLGLEVLDHGAPAPDGNGATRDSGEVEFVARLRVAGREQQLHERSRFVRTGGRWLYLDAVGATRP
jgi:SEC-C motif-containing protein